MTRLLHLVLLIVVIGSFKGSAAISDKESIRHTNVLELKLPVGKAGVAYTHNLAEQLFQSGVYGAFELFFRPQFLKLNGGNLIGTPTNGDGGHYVLIMLFAPIDNKPQTLVRLDFEVGTGDGS